MDSALPLLSLFAGACVLVTWGLGTYLSRVFQGERTWLTPLCQPLEHFLLRLITGAAEPDQPTWQTYCRDLLTSNLLAGLLAFFIIRFQDHLPLNPLKLPGMEPLQAFNTVASFITNTNWQSYSGEVALSNFSQMAAVTFWMIIGATTGLVVCVAFLRMLTHRPMGNYYRDFIRGLLYVMLPVMVAGTLFFVSQGVPQTFTQRTEVKTVEGATQQIALGPVASLLAIKQFGTNGGGFYNANSAHPLENPTPLTNLIEILLELSLPMALVFTFGLWLKDRKEGWLIWGGMAVLMAVAVFGGLLAEQTLHPSLIQLGINAHPSPLQTGGNLEGKEVRFDLPHTMLFVAATTGTSSGAVNTMHDSLTPLGGMIPMLLMMLNVVFGGVGVGLMGYLLYGILAVFITGLMVGRTPEIFGKKIEKGEIILASLITLVHPVLILLPTAISVIAPFGVSSLNNAGPHGLSEILYAYTSAAANNGSAFAGLNANTPWYNVSIGYVILMGRYVSIIGLLAIGASLLAKPQLAPGPGTLRTNTLLFTGVWLGVILILNALTFVPALALGPVLEHLSLLAKAWF